MKEYLVIVKNDVDCTHHNYDYDEEGAAKLAFKGFVEKSINDSAQFTSVELLVYNPATLGYHLIAVFDYYY